MEKAQEFLWVRKTAWREICNFDPLVAPTSLYCICAQSSSHICFKLVVCHLCSADRAGRGRAWRPSTPRKRRSSSSTTCAAPRCSPSTGTIGSDSSEVSLGVQGSGPAPSQKDYCFASLIFHTGAKSASFGTQRFDPTCLNPGSA